MHCDLEISNIILDQGMTNRWVMDNKCVNIIKIQLGSDELWRRHGFSVYMHRDLDLVDMNLGQGHNTPLSYGQPLYEKLSWTYFLGSRS